MSAVIKPTPTLAPFFGHFAALPLFVIWQRMSREDGRVDKVPISLTTGRPIDAQLAENRVTLAEAELRVSQGMGDGVGIVITPESGLFFLDLDKCRDASGWMPHAAYFVTRLPGAYVEVSQSGQGLHVIASYRDERPIHGTRNKTYRLEMYTGLRFCALTGIQARGYVERDHTEEFRRLCAEFFPRGEERSAEWREGPVPEWSGPTDDAELIERALRATSARGIFGGRAQFRDLWTANADVLAHTFPPFGSSTWDGSGADLALANHLAFWTGNDCARMAKLMRESALVRSKWDRIDYFEGTILKACANQQTWYAGDRSKPSRHTAESAMPAPRPAESDVNMGALNPSVAAEIRAASSDTLFLPNDHLPDTVAAQRIFGHLGGTRELFRRSDAVVELTGKGGLAVVTPTMLQSRLNERGRKVRSFSVDDKKNQFVHRAKRCGESAAKVMLSTLSVKVLPEIRIVTRLPILVERAGVLAVTQPGYNADSGVLVTSDVSVPVVPLAEAASSLSNLLDDYQFAENGDRARALASMIGPALRMGRLIDSDALIVAVEADKSQTGKGYYLKIVRAIYGEKAPLLTQRTGGVGSFDESLSQALLDGSPFISFDNLRGVLNSPFLEAVVTAGGDPVPVRVPHRAAVPIDVRYTTLQLTSNGVQGTTDFSKRLLLVRLRVQPTGYRYKKYPEGDVLTHIEANTAYYLGCVHAVVRCWHRAGKPKLESDHSFRHWTGSLDWIVQTVWQTAPLLEGHDTALSRIADPRLSWLRVLAVHVIQSKRDGRELRASDLREICREHDNMPPQTRPDCDNATADQAIGRVLGGCFREAAEAAPTAATVSIELDGLVVARTTRQEWDPVNRKSRDIRTYTVTRTAPRPPV